MSKTSAQYQVPAVGGSLTKVDVTKPVPEAHEICIRPKAVALNPIDWKSRDYGVMVQSWPAVLGSDVAGIVESLGEGVKDFKVGDEVLALGGMGNRGGAFQEIITISSQQAAKKPASLSFEEAASLPLCYVTAGTGITEGLKMPLPLGSPAHDSLGSILVLGGSSAIGAAAIQLLRLSLPSATILATSDKKHHAHLISLGCNKCFERSAQGDPSTIKAATAGGLGVDAIFDTVSAAAKEPNIMEAFSPDGRKLYSQIITGDEVSAPKGVTATTIFGRKILNSKDGRAVMPGLAALIEEGKYKVSLKVEVVGQGFESIQQGLDKLKQGASGTKYVITL